MSILSQCFYQPCRRYLLLERRQSCLNGLGTKSSGRLREGNVWEGCPRFREAGSGWHSPVNFDLFWVHIWCLLVYLYALFWKSTMHVMYSSNRNHKTIEHIILVLPFPCTDLAFGNIKTYKYQSLNMDVTNEKLVKKYCIIFYNMQSFVLYWHTTASHQMNQ